MTKEGLLNGAHVSLPWFDKWLIGRRGEGLPSADNPRSTVHGLEGHRREADVWDIAVVLCSFVDVKYLL